MKKIFTLIAVAFMAMSVNAEQYSIGVPTNNADGWFDAGTNTIHFLEANSYKPGWWLAWNNTTQSNSGLDASAYTRFVVELSDIPEGKTIACLLEYVTEGVETQFVTADATGKIVFELDEKGKSAVKQAYLQANMPDADVPSFTAFDVKFVKAYFENDDAPSTTKDIDYKTIGGYSADADAFNFKADPGDCSVGAGWYSKWFGTFDPTDYPYLIIEVASTTGDVQFLCQGSNPDGASMMILKSEEPQTYTLDLTGWTNIKQIAFQNFNFADPSIEDWNEKQKTIQETTMKITSMYLSKEPAATSINNVLENKTPNNAIYNLAGQKVNAQYKGVVIKNGKKVMQ